MKARNQIEAEVIAEAEARGIELVRINGVLGPRRSERPDQALLDRLEQDLDDDRAADEAVTPPDTK